MAISIMSSVSTVCCTAAAVAIGVALAPAIGIGAAIAAGAGLTVVAAGANYGIDVIRDGAIPVTFNTGCDASAPTSVFVKAAGRSTLRLILAAVYSSLLAAVGVVGGIACTLLSVVTILSAGGVILALGFALLVNIAMRKACAFDADVKAAVDAATADAAV